MNSTRRGVVTGAVASLSLLLASCGGGEQGDQSGGQSGGQDQAASQSQVNQQMPQGGSQEMAPGVTTAEDVYGPGCSQVPTDPNNEGSVQGMIDDPVGTAASNNPLLTSLTKAVQTAGLVDTLNKPEAQYTVFAPADPAFEALPADTLTALLNDPAKKEQLRNILTYHVVPERMDAAALGEAGTVETVQGEQVTIEGSGRDITVSGAKVLCGNVPTANATVFVVDEVLMPPQQ